MKVETRKQGNGRHVVYLVEGDLLVTKGLFTSKIKATKEAKRVADLYGCNRVLSISKTSQIWS